MMKNLINIVFIITITSFISCNQTSNSDEEKFKLEFLDSFNASNPNLNVLIKKMKTPIVSKPFNTSGIITIKNKNFYMNIKDMMELNFSILFSKEDENIFYYDEAYTSSNEKFAKELFKIRESDNKIMKIRIEPTSEYENSDVIIYLDLPSEKGLGILMLIGKTIYN